MKKIFTVSGRSNLGKSQTIKAVYEQLFKVFPDLKVIRDIRETEIEIRAVISVNGHRIGVESRGDNRKIVDESLSIFAEAKCQFILCATRSRGGTTDAVQEFAQLNKFTVETILKIGEPDVTAQSQANKKLARKIVKDIEALLSI
ncbi:hypothetical protein AEP_02248 [Curvibacter sp. AEP1-3]|uniref:hypothetical protein n=1 Tax=Curvibacter sp. AEP1-3 TaxID=1844971 RepID=UPI000B54EBEC|nr:hypothetical protein [Curvibacter sp. AEP1-3]ARV19175.1 hypothetical protein AEP_02248 [Curvibacter sp. AEP1-3]